MEQMFKFIKRRNWLERSASSATCTGTRPKDKKTAPSPPVRNESVRLPIRNGTITYNITPVVSPSHGGDDSAIDELLEGRMDLDVVLPDNKKVSMTVERRTPMMDLLVKVATPNKIKPGGHMIQVHDKGHRCLFYNPSTPIGSLDTKTVYIVPKKQQTESKKLKFEQTFRLQIRLPHNQLIAYRFSLKETLGEVKQKVCKEKNLDPSMYHLVHPNHQDKILDANMTFEEYNCKEISLLSAKSIDANSSQVITL
ncbi:cordon-bleu protein-like 1 [Limulus polyphemus]|uniref:Cordon-bleu protein-like 1 n=1 Tax=Limulus polyphemus TaxID=6850 RepID=A0ABM1SDM3_LIMPO|nr:cordon-bleu protein-like 1 [Limulus polyphemus]